MPARILAGLLAVAVLVAAGCGSSSSSSSSSSTTSAATSSNTSTAATPSNTSTTKSGAKPAKENLPPGDIPDNIAYVPFQSPDGFVVKVPESFSRTTQGGATIFTDKLNSVRVESQPAKSAPTVAEAKSTFVPQIQKTAKGFTLKGVDTVTRPAGKAVRILYVADSAPNAVTGKTRPDAVEQYLFFHNGKLVILTLSGPTTADNVDPWKLVTGSLRFTK
jgi:hypothetical protein